MATIGLDSSKFEKGMHHVKESALDNIKTFAMAAIGVGAVEQAFERTFETAGKLVDEAQRLDITVEQVQLLKQAAKDAGAEFDAVASSLEKINLARAKALGGGAEGSKMLETFAKFGISKEDLLNKGASELFTGKISQTVKSNNIEEITAPLKEILGKGAGQLVATMKTDFDELGDKMKSMGAIMSNDTAAKLDKLGDEFELITKIIVTQLGPAILAFTEWAWKAILKTGGTLAAGGAAIGDIAGQKGWVKTAEIASDLIGQGFKDVITGKSDKEIMANRDTLLKSSGVDVESVKDASKAAAEPWLDSLEEFKRSMADVAEKLANPPKHNFQEANESGGKPAIKTRSTPQKEADSLVRIGNFLGTNVGAMNGANNRLQKAAIDTAANTKQTAMLLKMALERATKTRGAASFESIFPLNT